MAQRYQREIEEILGQTGEEGDGGGSDGSKPPRSPRRVARAPRRRLGRFIRPTPGRLLLAGLVLIVLLILLDPLLDVSLVNYFLGASVVLFVFAYVVYFTRPRRAVERRWRGQPMDDPEPAGPLSRLWRWITGG